jgi:type IV secretory pathway VirB2 component (pilin)
MARNKSKNNSKFWEFEREFSKQLTAIITGGFALIVALIWKDAIRVYLDQHQEIVQTSLNLESWVVQFLFAFRATIVAVVGIIITKKLLIRKK